MGSVVVVHRHSCPAACGIFTLWPLRWQANLNHWTTRKARRVGMAVILIMELSQTSIAIAFFTGPGPFFSSSYQLAQFELASSLKVGPTGDLERYYIWFPHSVSPEGMKKCWYGSVGPVTLSWAMLIWLSAVRIRQKGEWIRWSFLDEEELELRRGRRAKEK